jgi:ketosteroid isomerase-like protein
MSQENVEVVKSVQPSGIDLVELFRASRAPDPSATGIDLTAFESDFETEFIARRAFGSIRPNVSRGLQGFVESWRDWLEPWESYYVEAEGFIDAGDEVVSLTRVLAQTTRDAVAVEHRPGAVWSVREGKIVCVRFYLERQEALEAVGLREEGTHTSS